MPGTDRPRLNHDGSRRRLAAGLVLTCVVLGLTGVGTAAWVGHGTPRVTATTLVHQGAASATYVTSTTSVPVTTTTAAPATTVPTTTPPPPPTTAAHPVTVPPTTQARPPATVVTTARIQISPSTAGFPSTPPPYWPMPIVHVTITDSGGAGLRSIVVHPVGVYSVPSNTCSTLASGQSCGADVQFCPSSPGHYVNTLSVTGVDAATGAPIQATTTLDGTAT